MSSELMFVCDPTLTAEERSDIAKHHGDGTAAGWLIVILMNVVLAVTAGSIGDIPDNSLFGWIMHGAIMFISVVGILIVFAKHLVPVWIVRELYRDGRYLILSMSSAETTCARLAQSDATSCMLRRILV